MTSRQYKRHDRSDIFIHWFNAACWFLLLVTGLALFGNPDIDPLGSGYPAFMRSLVGGGGNLLTIHVTLGLVWAGGLLLYMLINLKGAIFFLKEVFMVDPARDIVWMIRKMILMTAGPKLLGKNAELPDQGYYNMGQKAFAQASVVGGIVIVVTGIIMFLSDRTLGPEHMALVSWSITLHYLAVGLVFAGLLVHIYMAAISPEEKPGFRSMFTGHVPEDYAKHHHKLWYDKVKDNPSSEV
ncbi:formate dehydrogenase subunit gamma [Desulfovibrio sp. JC022]|uniref:formate dehydrogenase subunit gamma n=1 Tax=Desulfovibrio sp. JC022 TaxID=2593642 RepID=UPI0013D6E7A6|nr:cytochrome b/b6 domain-containing protein [Desulfovibrio sp. JC022]NDV23392.1 cytochrome B6 [Desulfovibrio sp. JC022]